MAQSTTNLGKIHVFPSEALYNQFKDIIADNDLALLKDDGAYIVAALLEQNGYVVLYCELCVFSLSCFWQDKILIYSFIIHVFSFLRPQ